MADFLGANVLDVDSSPMHTLGTRIRGVGPDGFGEWTYVKANGTIAADIPTKLASGFLATASGNAGQIDGVTEIAVVSGNYFWLHIGGKHSNANVATGSAAGAILAYLADANGDFVTGTEGTTVGTAEARAKCLVAESVGLSDILLWYW